MKQTVKKFNNFIKKTIFKVQNKTNDNFKINGFNKYLITITGLLFIYLFYLLIPLLYSKTWLQTNIKDKLLGEFKINVSISSDISYHVFPIPHFLIKDSKILIDDGEIQKSIAEIKNLKIFLSQRNFFNKKKMNFTQVVIDDANFSLLERDLKHLNEVKNKNFSNKKIKISNSNIFFKDNLSEIISMIKIDEAFLFFNDEKQSNFLNIGGEIFNLPFTFDFMNYKDPIKYEEINFKSKLLKLSVFNSISVRDNKKAIGENIISFLNSTFNTKYYFKEKLIIFEDKNSKIDSLQINYNGKLSINPFDLDLNIYLRNYKISRLTDINPVLIEFIQSGLLFNDNISISTSAVINSNSKNDIFQNAKINFHIINGKIDLNKTKLISDDIGSLELRNSNIFFKDNKLKFNSDILIDITNSDNLFSTLNTNKLLRKNFKNILINLDYDFSDNLIIFNNIKIDNKDVNDQLLNIFEGFNDKAFNNFNNSRRIINELLKAYDG